MVLNPGRITMSSRLQILVCAALAAAPVGLPASGWAQTADLDPEIRIERLENQLRRLTGQNEELQYRNRQLEEQLRALQAGAPASPPAVTFTISTAPLPRLPSVLAVDTGKAAANSRGSATMAELTLKLRASSREGWML